jgi:hypothetical protein
VEPLLRGVFARRAHCEFLKNRGIHMRKLTSIMILFGATIITTPAFAGEVNGSTTNPKHYYSNGVSICKFSGLNDNPTSTDPDNPGGRFQSYGQWVSQYDLDPQVYNPSDPGGCNGSTDPYRTPGNPNN